MDKNHIPKIELHCHLDGSVRPKTIIDLAKKNNISIPSYDLEHIKELSVAPDNCKSLKEYLDRFQLPIKVMQTKDALERITFELLEDAVFENVKYMEIRFAPILHTENGMSEEDVIKAVESGIMKAEKFFNIEANIIVCCLKHLSKESSINTIKSAVDSGCLKVKGIDLAGAEDEGFADKFIDVMDYAKSCGFEITIHAGEAASYKNVVDSINLLGASRIGHGVRIIENDEAINFVKDNNILLEICPTSNVQTKAVSSFETHPIKKLVDGGVKISINTDNRTVSDTCMSEEFEKSSNYYNMDDEDFIKIYIDSVKASFADRETKNRLINIIDKNYPQLSENR